MAYKELQVISGNAVEGIGVLGRKVLLRASIVRRFLFLTG
jgi:hypothetical protein